MGTSAQATLEEEQKGIVPRAIADIFRMAKEKLDQVTTTIKVSFIEIYKEEIRDLLEFSLNNNREIHIREDDRGNTQLSGVREQECSNEQELFDCLEIGSNNRATGSTQMNEVSSRSHCIFTVSIVQEWSNKLSEVLNRPTTAESDYSTSHDDLNHCITGKFHFVDLAGSERARKTGNRGDRLKESIHINSGLLALGNVISSLGDPTRRKTTHVPYRESKITRLLKDSLGGNAQTLMICCVSPAWSNCDESVNALNYANRARNIRNKPVINRDRTSRKIEEMQTEIANLRAELSRRQISSHMGDFSNSDLSAVHMNGSSEATVTQLRLLCEHYASLVTQARDLIGQLLNNGHIGSLIIPFQEWLDLASEMDNQVPTTLDKDKWENATIRRLQTELHQMQRDLNNDVEIFAEKSKEANRYQETIHDLEMHLKTCENHMGELEDRCRQQEGLLVEQQRQLQKMQELQRQRNHQPSCADPSSDQANNKAGAAQPPGHLNHRRVKSGPAKRHQGLRKSIIMDVISARDIKTSPALFNIERVIEGFRARSQILASRWEDGDDVIRVDLDDDMDSLDNDVDNNTTPSQGGFKRVGTFKLPPRKNHNKVANPSEATVCVSVDDGEDVDEAFTSANAEHTAENAQRSEYFRKQIKLSQLRLVEANQKQRDLSINIRLKEQLIKELVKSSKDSQTLNQKYETKIRLLEEEKETAQKEYLDLMNKLNAIQGEESVEIKKMKEEYERKVHEKQKRLEELNRRQQDTEKLASFSVNQDKKLQDLMLTIEKMKQDQVNIQKRLKQESEKKIKLEKELQKDQERIRTLEIQNEHQQKILKRKQEEIAAAHKRLRNASIGDSQPDRHLMDQRRLLDEEMERILQQKSQIQSLENELKQREIILNKKEAALNEKAEIEINKLRVGNQVDKDYLTASSRLAETEKVLLERQRELVISSERDRNRIEKDIEELRNEKNKWLHKRKHLESKLQKGDILTDQEQRRLIELDVAIETLDKAIDCKDEGIRQKQENLKHAERLVAASSETLFLRLRTLDIEESQQLLMEYFEQVIALKTNLQKRDLHNSELEVKSEELERLTQQLQSTLQRQMAEADRQLTQMQQSYEEQLGVLMSQLANSGSTTDSQVQLLEKIDQIERELLATKKANREMKKKIREWVLSGRLLSAESEVAPDGADITHQSLDKISNSREMSSHRSKQTGASYQAGNYSTKVKADGRWERVDSTTPRPGEFDKSRPTPRQSDSNVLQVSRKDLRQLTESEVASRKSQISVVDSLEDNKRSTK